MGTGTIAFTEGSDLLWEPGSVRVPTFSSAPGSANDGDLPLRGEGGGDPKSELESSSVSIMTYGTDVTPNYVLKSPPNSLQISSGIRVNFR